MVSEPLVINAKTRLIGILGHPISHSLSPVIHNASLRELGLNCCYLAFDVPPDRLTEAVAGMRSLGFLGCNVTIPHKEAVIPLMDSLSDEARAVGAVNTIVCRNGQLIGYNTDVMGFLAPLDGRELAGRSMTILGAGGAARAVAYALLQAFAPARLWLAARRVSQAKRLARDLASSDSAGVLTPVNLADARAQVRASALVVNATPVGLYPHTDATPWPYAEDFWQGQNVYDLVYRPRDTRLLREARGRGADVWDGVSMLVHQAAAAFVQWTGKPMPVKSVEEALDRILQ